MLVTQEQQVVLREATGNQLMQWIADDIVSLSWGRELRQTSKANLTLDSILSSNGHAPPIYPWLHWIDVYSMDSPPKLYWSGPLQSISMDQFGTQITAADVSAYLARTRIGRTQAWDAVDPSIPALALWQDVLQAQGLPFVQPIQRLDPWGDRFDYQMKSDTKMADKVIQDMEQMGLRWTVVSGVPVLGPMPYEPIASLGQGDFLKQGVMLSRDGSNTYNDILLRAADSIAHGRVELAGLNLQTIVNVNNMFGLTNANAAVQQYARHVGRLMTSIQIPQGAVLNPNVDLSVDQMVPSARFAVSAFDVRIRMELEALQVQVQRGLTQVQVTLQEVPDWTEIGEMLKLGAQSSVQSGTRTSVAGGSGSPSGSGSTS